MLRDVGDDGLAGLARSWHQHIVRLESGLWDAHWVVGQDWLDCHTISEVLV